MKTCKYCEELFNGSGSYCMKCREKQKLLPRFVRARDRLRLATGKQLMGEKGKLIEFAERLKERLKGVGVHNAIDCVLLEMVGDDNG